MTTDQKSVAIKTLENCEPEGSLDWWYNVEDQIHLAASKGLWSCKIKSIQGCREYVSNYLKMLGFSVYFYENTDDEEYVEISWRF